MKRIVIAMGIVASLFFGALSMGTAQAAPGADNLRVASQQCMPDGSVTMTIAWSAYNQGPQQLDVSAFSNAFQPGTYMSYAMPAVQNSYVVTNLRPGTPYYVRVTTATSGGFIATPTSAFGTTGCLPYFNWYVGPYVQPIAPVNAIFGQTIGTWINGRYYTQVISVVNTPMGPRYYTQVISVVKDRKSVV